MHTTSPHPTASRARRTAWPRLALAATLLAAGMATQAQDYPQKDSNGATVYYKVLSASPQYGGMCLEDNSSQGTQYAIGLAAHEAGNTLQEWTLQPGTTAGTYLLRNRRTYRYLGATGSWAGPFYAMGMAAKAAGALTLTLTPLGDSQVTLTYQEGTTTRYLLVGDTDKGPEIFEKKGHKDTSRAWLILPSTAIPSDITTAQGAQVSIQAIGRHIVVSGTRDYSVHDLQGRPVDKEAELQPGVYVVEAAGTVRNVLVK